MKKKIKRAKATFCPLLIRDELSLIAALKAQNLVIQISNNRVLATFFGATNLMIYSIYS